MKRLQLSALDVVPVFENQTIREAVDRAADIARGLEKMDFQRYLVAEHHNSMGTASSANDILIGYLLDKTSVIQIGAGGVMMPNHTPLETAETYGTLDALYPGRVDLGFGRAPGTDPLTSSLIARRDYADVNDFVRDVAQVLHWFKPVEEQGQVTNFAGAGAQVHPIILGSSLASAYAAAALGLPYAFAAHISPGDAQRAVEIYRENFHPSSYLRSPYVIVSVWLFAGRTEAEAEERFAVSAKRLLETLQGRKKTDGLPLTSAEKILMKQRMGTSLKGTAKQIAEQFEDLNEQLQPDELMGVASGRTAESVLTMYEILQEALKKWIN